MIDTEASRAEASAGFEVPACLVALAASLAACSLAAGWLFCLKMLPMKPPPWTGPVGAEFSLSLMRTACTWLQDNVIGRMMYKVALTS
jgi:hypothetical protein